MPPGNGVVPARPRQYFAASDGKPLAGGSVEVFYAGTTDRASTYADKALATLNPNPIPLNARGECVIFAPPYYTWKFVLRDKYGTTVYTEDNVLAGGDTPISPEFVIDRFSGNGVQKDFTLSTTPSSENNTAVYVGGVYVQKNAYSVAGNVLTFAVAPVAGTDNIEVQIIELVEFAATADSINAQAQAAQEAADEAAATITTIHADALAATTARTAAETARDQSYAAGRVFATAAAGDASGTLAVNDYYYVISALTPEIYELWRKTGTGGTDTGKRTPSTAVATHDALSPIARLVDVNSKGVETIDKAGKHYIAGMSVSLQKAIADLQVLAPGYQKRDQLIAETSRDADIATTTVFDFTNAGDGTIVFAPSIVRTGKSTAMAVCERRNFAGGGSGDASLKRVICRSITYERAARSIALGTVVEIANEVPTGSLGAYNASIGYVKTGTHAGRLLCFYSILGPYNNTIPSYYDYFAPYLRYSDDGGATWSAPIDMGPALAATAATLGNLIGPGHGIQLASGRIVFSGYRINTRTDNKAFLLYTDDGGDTWTVGPIFGLDQSNEGQVVDLKNGELLWLFRTNSDSNFKHFARLDATTLKILDAGIYAKSLNPTTKMFGEAIAIQTGLHQCANDWDTSTPKLAATLPSDATGARKEMKLFVSYNGGEPFQDSYPYTRVLNPGRLAEYSDLTNFGPNDLFCLYSDDDPAQTGSTRKIVGSLVSISAYMGS